MAKTVTSLLPTLLEWLGNWNVGGRQGPCLIPSMVSSHSANTAPVTSSPSHHRAMVLNALGINRKNRATTGGSSHSVSCMPRVGGVSSLAELDALKVTKRLQLNDAFISLRFTGIFDALHAYMFVAGRHSVHSTTSRGWRVEGCCQG